MYYCSVYKWINGSSHVVWHGDIKGRSSALIVSPFCFPFSKSLRDPRNMKVHAKYCWHIKTFLQALPVLLFGTASSYTNIFVIVCCHFKIVLLHKIMIRDSIMIS